MNWIEVSKCNLHAKAMAEHHYSYRAVKSRAMGKEIGPPGQKIILLTEDGKALWGSHRPAPWAGVKRQDGFAGPCCFIFRNEGYPVLSSKLIREAVAITAHRWGIAEAGFLSYVAIEKVQSENPGYCFLRAGFDVVGYTDSNKLGRLRKFVMSKDEIMKCLEEYPSPLSLEASLL